MGPKREQKLVCKEKTKKANKQRRDFKTEMPRKLWVLESQILALQGSAAPNEKTWLLLLPWCQVYSRDSLRVIYS